MKPAVGQIWQEVDPRCERYIIIESTRDIRPAVRGCDKNGIPMPRSRCSYANPLRFSGKRGGYKYIGEKS